MVIVYKTETVSSEKENIHWLKSMHVPPFFQLAYSTVIYHMWIFQIFTVWEHYQQTLMEFMVKLRRSINPGNYLLMAGIFSKTTKMESDEIILPVFRGSEKRPLGFTTAKQIIEICTHSAQENLTSQQGWSRQWWVCVTSKFVVYSWCNMVRVTSTGGSDDGMSMRRQRIRTKFCMKRS